MSLNSKTLLFANMEKCKLFRVYEYARQRRTNTMWSCLLAESKKVELIVAESTMMVARERLESETSENMANGEKTLLRIKMHFEIIIDHCASN